MQWESKYILVCTVHTHIHAHAQLYRWQKQNATHMERKKIMLQLGQRLNSSKLIINPAIH